MFCILCIFGIFSSFPRFFAHCLEKDSPLCYCAGKEVINMKKVTTLAAKIAKKTAENALRRDANQTTCSIIFQPKAPAGLNRFKKENA